MRTTLNVRTILHTRSFIVSKSHGAKAFVCLPKILRRSYVTEVLSAIGDVPTICILGLAAFGAYTLIRYFLPPSDNDEEEEAGESPDPNPVNFIDSSTQTEPLSDLVVSVQPDSSNLPDFDTRLESLQSLLIFLYSEIRKIFPEGDDTNVDRVITETNIGIDLHWEQFNAFPSIYEEIYFSNVTLLFVFKAFLPLLLFFVRYRILNYLMHLKNSSLFIIIKKRENPW